ncbi:MAG: molecular chaperone DnaJ [Bacteroidetes bacterium GWE2_29_8]|nr:MAG: molecular chaperone DnaJ [Bacteroidetes bacterium GWE2_29_8]
MIFVDYYKILEIDKSATQKDIKNAYRKLARKFHPDLNISDKEAKVKFQQINEANEVLSNIEKRKKYDQYGKDWQHSDEFEKARQYQEQSSNQNGSNYSRGQSSSNFSDFFESMFSETTNNDRRKQTRYRGEDYKTELHLNLIDVYKTTKQTLNVNGKKIRISIPAGIENGQTIKIANHGGLGTNGGPNGDLYITFSIENLINIKRLGNNLYTTIILDLYIAVLGGEITIDTLNGKVKLKVMPETQNGSKIKLKGKGLPVYKNEGLFGDLFVTYEIQIPTNLNDKQKALFIELSNL